MRSFVRRGARLAVAIDAALPSTEHRSTTRGNGMLAIVSLLGLGFAADAVAGNTFTVNTTGDPGPGGTTSLRQAVASANVSAGNTVQFGASLVGSTITLAGTAIEINQPMFIVGPGASKLTISGNDASQIFRMIGCPGTTPIYVSGVSLTHGNSTTVGGAIETYNCWVHLTDSTVTASHAALRGGGVYAKFSKLVVENCTISGNSSGYSGGSVGLRSAAVSILRSTLSGNAATYKGGGVFADGVSPYFSYLRLDYSTVSGNTIPAPPGGSYTQGGGGVFARASAFVSAGSTIANNYAYSGGSGVALSDTYSGNHATIYSSTIAGNNSCCYETGNGIASAGGQPKLDSNIVANNFSRAGIYDLAGSFSVNSSLVRNAGSATITGNLSIFGVDPKLSRLGDYGGPTQTMVPAADSPAVDAELTCFSFLSFDQRGLPRCVNGKVDMGAVERQIPEDLIFRDGFDTSG